MVRLLQSCVTENKAFKNNRVKLAEFSVFLSNYSEDIAMGMYSGGGIQTVTLEDQAYRILWLTRTSDIALKW